MVAQVAAPEDMGEIQKYEDPESYQEDMGDRLAKAKGWLRPLAIRATSGHSFTGDHRNPLLVNIDHENVNIRLTHEFASKNGRRIPCDRGSQPYVDRQCWHHPRRRIWE